MKNLPLAAGAPEFAGRSRFCLLFPPGRLTFGGAGLYFVGQGEKETIYRKLSWADKMKISIDGRTDIVSADDGYSLGEILRQIDDFLRERGRMTVRATLDDNPLTRSDTTLLKRKVDEFGLLDISTKDIREQAVQALSEVRSHLPVIVQKVVRVSEQIQSGGLDEGYKTLVVCADMVNLVVRVIEEVRILAGIDLDALDLPGASVGERIGEVRDVLKATKEALDARDAVTVADLMEYELAPKLKGWDEVLEGLMQKVGN